jgi:short subunit dehydrogenase-like uncharacterized protein
MKTKPVPIVFLPDADIAIISNSSLIGKCVGIYTENKGSPIVNYCERCARSYYDLFNVGYVSSMVSTVRLTRCPHSRGVKGYLISM